MEWRKLRLASASHLLALLVTAITLGLPHHAQAAIHLGSANTVSLSSGLVDTGTLRMYINGTLKDVATGGAMDPRAAPDGSQYFTGNIDDVRIYNRALSAAEIKQLYNASR